MQQQLGILDFGYINPPQLFAHQVINSLFSEVGLYDELGYKRLWLSEHYSSEFAWYNPEPLLPLLAGYSSKIKVGLAGILLNHHSPLRVAQSFKLLSAIYGDRINLGIARAGVPDYISKYLYPNDVNGSQTWESQLKHMFSFLNVANPDNSLIKTLVVPPQGTELPETWFLAASGRSISEAVQFKSNFCLSFMHPGTDYPKTSCLIKQFVEQYTSAHHTQPDTAILLCCAEPDSKQEFTNLTSKYNPVHNINPFGEINLIVDRLQKLLYDTGAREVVIFNPSVDRQKRIDFFSRLMDKWKASYSVRPPQLQSY
jgi:alkanesulfonate monooxygenase SsuD/methylene tetrahydromethanopterin reductase-like flavin-dependent oxidoreductase (luciferase family)